MNIIFPMICCLRKERFFTIQSQGIPLGKSLKKRRFKISASQEKRTEADSFIAPF
ncbi:MAG: hypothetical protein Q8O10_03370 [candidate division Zixibacteria bacterium]|nr:hypothetical protein [candidate division Zixibacteria bacterium]